MYTPLSWADRAKMVRTQPSPPPRGVRTRTGPTSAPSRPPVIPQPRPGARCRFYQTKTRSFVQSPCPGFCEEKTQIRNHWNNAIKKNENRPRPESRGITPKKHQPMSVFLQYSLLMDVDDVRSGLDPDRATKKRRPRKKYQKRHGERGPQLSPISLVDAKQATQMAAVVSVGWRGAFFSCKTQTPGTERVCPFVRRRQPQHEQYTKKNVVAFLLLLLTSLNAVASCPHFSKPPPTLCSPDCPSDLDETVWEESGAAPNVQWQVRFPKLNDPDLRRTVATVGINGKAPSPQLEGAGVREKTVMNATRRSEFNETTSSFDYHMAPYFLPKLEETKAKSILSPKRHNVDKKAALFVHSAAVPRTEGRFVPPKLTALVEIDAASQFPRPPVYSSASRLPRAGCAIRSFSTARRVSPSDSTSVKRKGSMPNE